MRILVAGGGSGGHIFPAIAICKYAMAHGHEAMIVGQKGRMEEELVPQHGVDLRLIDANQFVGKTPTEKLTAVGRMSKVVNSSQRILREFKPDVVVGVGGYVSFPVLLAAKLRRIPIIVYESNGLPGKANSLLSKIADRVFTPFGSCLKYFPANKSGVAAVVKHGLKADLKRRVIAHEGFNVLVLGGSQGAHRINEVITDALPLLSDDVWDTAFNWREEF